jgi:thymidylate synthase
MDAYISLEKALQGTLVDVCEKGIVTSPRGRQSKELIGHGYVLTNPRARIIGLAARNLNPFYLVGNLLWVLRQSNKLEVINYYNPRGSMFSDDGEILRGAYGKRIFDFDGINQWKQCYNELKVDPDSRRAIVSIHLPQHDWTGSLDTPCTADFQFLLRDNKLHMVNHMRSQSAAFVQPYDVFLMTMIQELMANELGVELGIYKHICNSYHYFTNEQDMVDAIIESEDYTPSMQHMVGGMAEVKLLLTFEALARKVTIELAQQGLLTDIKYLERELDKLGLPTFWNNIGEVLIAKAINLLDGNNGATYLDYVRNSINNGNPFKKLLLQLH